MGWIEQLISKRKPKCFICDKVLDGAITEILYRYGEDQGEIGSVQLCAACGKDIKGHDPKEDDAIDDEPI